MSSLKPKILFIVTQAQWGGAQKYVFDLANNLAEEFEITVATGRSDNKLKAISYKLKAFEFKHLVRAISPIQDLLAIWEISRFLKKEKFDLVHLNSSKAGFIGALANLLAGRPSKIIYTAHGWVFLEPLSWLTKKIYLWLEKISAQLRDATIVLGESEKVIALKYGAARPNSLVVISQGLDFSKLKFLPQEEARAALGLDTNTFIIGAIANNYPTKGLKFFDEAIKKINQVFHVSSFMLHAVVIGENFEARFDNLISLGPREEAYQYLKAFDMFVLPSVKEGFPYVLLEALAAGLPIVATGVGAVPEIIEDDKSGLVVPPADPPALAQAISKLITDENLRKKFGEAALARSKDFDFQNTLEKTKTIYQNVLAQPLPRRF